jgi:hypothetical protein
MDIGEAIAFFHWYVDYLWVGNAWLLHRSDRAPCPICVDLWRKKQLGVV